jgi:dihydrolipoamide dehydrogenase
MADQQYSPRDGQAFDVVLIGGGTGGYVAAIRAAQLGLDAVVVETDKLGGTCLHRGCIPTKAFLKSADVYEEVQHSAEFGVDIAGEVAFNYPAALDRSLKVVNGQYKGLQYLFDKKYKIPVIAGFGRIAGPGQVEVTPADGGAPFTLTTRNIIIDTGTRPRAIKDLPFDGKRVINSDDAVELETLPQSFIIRGGGAVGVEWASIYGRYGSKVSLVGRVVPSEDEEAAAVLIRAFKRQGITVFPTSRPTADDIDVTKSGVRMRVKDDRGKEEVVEADVLLVAIGREGNVEDIGLEKVGVATEDGLIPVDAMMRTNVPNVFAIGDVNGQQMLAHTAMHMGVIAVEHIAGHDPYPLDVLNSPMVTFCRPEIASVGLTEKQAVDQGRTVKTGKFRRRDRWLCQGRCRCRNQRHARHDHRRSACDGAYRRLGDGAAARGDTGRDRNQCLSAPDGLRGHPRGRARSPGSRTPYLDCCGVIRVHELSPGCADSHSSTMRWSRGNASSGNSEMANHPTSTRSSPARGSPAAKVAS